MIIQVQNKITQEYLKGMLNKDVLFKTISLDDQKSISSLNETLMYFDKAIIRIIFSKEYHDIISMIDKETDEVRLVFSVNNVSDVTYLSNILERKKKKFKVLTLKTIPKAKCISLIGNILTELSNRSYKDELLEEIYKHLCFSGKVDEELQMISRMSTIKQIREYIRQNKNVRNSNYAYKLLAGERTSFLGTYLINNVSNINYSFKILENFVEGYLDIYPFIDSKELNSNSIKDFVTSDSNKSKNYSLSQVKQYMDISKIRTYENMFLLAKTIKECKTRVNKLNIFRELLVNGNTNRI